MRRSATKARQLPNYQNGGSGACMSRRSLTTSARFRRQCLSDWEEVFRQATIRVPSEEWSSFQCHFYILSHSLSPVRRDSRCYLLPCVYLKCYEINIKKNTTQRGDRADVLRRSCNMSRFFNQVFSRCFPDSYETTTRCHTSSYYLQTDTANPNTDPPCDWI